MHDLPLQSFPAIYKTGFHGFEHVALDRIPRVVAEHGDAGIQSLFIFFQGLMKAGFHGRLVRSPRLPVDQLLTYAVPLIQLFLDPVHQLRREQPH